MKIGIVSTFSEQGYKDYAELFVDSLKNNLDKSIKVFLYVDNISIKNDSNIHILNQFKCFEIFTGCTFVNINS
jgi:hypothetical protein